MIKLWIMVILVSLASPCAAEDRTPWVEPPLGPLSAPGTKIETQDYQCSVASVYAINCINVGRACVQYRAEQEKRDARHFGCAIQGEKNYPCPTDNPPLDVNMARICIPMTLGGW